MDVSPIIPAGRQFVDSYGPGRFRISGVVYEGSVLVLPQATVAWPVSSVEELTAADFRAAIAADPPVEVVLLGAGPKMVMLPADLRRELKNAGVNLEVMDTGAACRTYNVLLSEERRVAAALIAL
jgi:uncharacterized protein